MRKKNRYEYACDECDYRSIIMETTGNITLKNISKRATELNWQQEEDGRLICPDCVELKTGEVYTHNADVKTTHNRLKAKLSTAFIGMVFVLSTMAIFSEQKPGGISNKIVELAKDEIFDETIVDIDPTLTAEIEKNPEKFLDLQHAVPDENSRITNNDISTLAAAPVKTRREIQVLQEAQISGQDTPLIPIRLSKLKLQESKTSEQTVSHDKIRQKTAKKLIEKLSAQIKHGRFIIFKGTVKSNLTTAAAKIGLNFGHVKKLISIFSYSIDFRSLAKGDRFSVVFDKSEFEKNPKTTKILAAEFRTRKKIHQRFRYTSAKTKKTAYYLLSSEGPSRTVRKITQGAKVGFLRYPLKYNRVSSNFNPRRKHPITGRTRPHRGTDFVAPRGTNVRSTSDGVVKFSGWQRGYGWVVFIKHQGGKYTTVYAHLSRINKRIKKGRRVQQNQVVGYVGNSGASTGNHLHYEFRVRGHAVNPLRVRLPTVGKIVKEKIIDPIEQRHFKQKASVMSFELKFARSSVKSF